MRRGQFGRAPVVLALLLVDVRLREVDERRGVDVDIEVARVDREANRRAGCSSVIASWSAAYFLALNW